MSKTTPITRKFRATIEEELHWTEYGVGDHGEQVGVEHQEWTVVDTVTTNKPAVLSGHLRALAHDYEPADDATKTTYR